MHELIGLKGLFAMLATGSYCSFLSEGVGTHSSTVLGRCLSGLPTNKRNMSESTAESVFVSLWVHGDYLCTSGLHKGWILLLLFIHYCKEHKSVGSL